MSANILVFIKLCVKKIYESESIQNLIELLIICLTVIITVIIVCHTVNRISENEFYLKKNKLDMLKDVLDNKSSPTDDIYKTFADAVSEV